MNVLLDTWTWIEFFKGTDKGKITQNLLVKDVVYTSAITLAEISKWVWSNNGDVDFFIEQIRKNSTILPLDQQTLVQSGKNYIELRKIKKEIGMIDVIIYTSAITHNLILVTGDSDFEGLVNVEMI